MNIDATFSGLQEHRDQFSVRGSAGESWETSASISSLVIELGPSRRMRSAVRCTASVDGSQPDRTLLWTDDTTRLASASVMPSKTVGNASRYPSIPLSVLKSTMVHPCCHSGELSPANSTGLSDGEVVAKPTMFDRDLTLGPTSGQGTSRRDACRALTGRFRVPVRHVLSACRGR